MSNDWEPGDLALCVNTSPIECIEGTHMGGNCPPHMSVTTVSDIGPSECGVCQVLVIDGGRYCVAARFIKVTPPEADEFDREVIDLMNQRERVA